jgi:hypothetical protein|tara:strand:- start:1533 stop:2087 length:555 start_codon:yes stop_codon:yes gene_type:complete
MAHAYGNGAGSQYYDSYSSYNNASQIDLTVQDGAESNQLVYIRGALYTTLGSQYISMQFLTNQGSVINSKYSSRCTAATNGYQGTSQNNIILNAWWFAGTGESGLTSRLFDFGIYIDMTRNQFGAQRGQWVAGFNDNNGYCVQGRGAFTLVSSTGITKVRFFPNGAGTAYLRGKVSSQVILGNY